MSSTVPCPPPTSELDAVEARIRSEFPQAPWYDLLVRVAARTDLERAAVERVADQAIEHERRIQRLEDLAEAAE